MHFLCRTHRSTGVQGAHEEESARMQRSRVTVRRKKTGWDRQGGKVDGGRARQPGQAREEQRHPQAAELLGATMIAL
jgi:hypothetical protein